MSNAVAKVSFLQGQAWAKTADGGWRALTVGSTLNEGEVLVTAQGARIELDNGTGEPLVINGGLSVGMSRDLLAQTATEADEALLSDASVQEALTVLEQGGDLLEELEETAAGNAGGGAGEGHSFVQLTRLIETTDSQSFDYSPANPTSRGQGTSEGEYTNRTPLVTDQAITSDEDEPFTGQIIAEDIEGDAITFTLTTPPSNGVVTLDPVTGQFTFTPNANYNGSDSFVVTVTDSHGNSADTSISLNIAPVNDAPTTADLSLATSEDIPINGQIQAQDIEGDTLSYSLSGQPANGSVVLDPTTGGFVYTPNTNYNGSDSFVVTINDGKGGTTTSTITIGVTAINDLPVSGNQSLTTSEDTPIAGQIAATDVDGDTLGYTVSGQPTNGTVVLNAATGDFTYTPNASYNGSDSFVVTVSDSNGGTTTSTITIGVNPANDAPVSSDQNLVTNEDVAVSGQVVAIDIDGDTLGYAVSGQPTNGTVVLNAATGSFTYTPNVNYSGSDSFVVTISDGKGGTTTSTIAIGVAPVNDAPTSSNLNLTTAEDTPISGQVTAFDSEGDNLAFSVSGNPTNGSVVINAATGSFTYIPNANYNGSDSFTVTISDGNGGTTTSLVSVGVTPVNDLPVASNLNLTTDEDTPVTGTISANDADGDTVSFVVSGNPVNGSVVLNPATGGFTYTPNTGYNGSDNFVVTVSDGNGGTITSTVTIGVNPVNDAPIANSDSATTDEDTAVTIAVRGNDTDPEGDNLTVTGVTQGTNGSVVIDAVSGNPIYTPNAGFSGSDSFTYTISDGNGGTATATVNVTVNAVNDAPVANNDTATTDEDTSVTIAVRGNDTDAEGNNLTVSIVTQGANGSVVIDAVSGNPIYTPNADFSGSDSFSYTISDGNGGTSTATVNVTVTAVNDAPVANNDTATTDEDTAVTIAVRGNDTDAEGNNLTVSSIIQGANGSVVIDAVTGNPVYTPNAGFSGSDSFSYTISDGNGGTATATVNVTVNAVNDAPVANNDTATTDEDTAVTIAVRANDTDVEGNNLIVSGVTQGTNGSVVIDAVSGNPVYTPNAGFSSSDSFTYTISDGNGGTATATVNVTVNAVNAAPVANGDTAAATGTGNIGLVSEYFGYNETSGSPNLTSVEQVYAFINGRTADATFIAKTFDYGSGTAVSTNLGNGTNLQTFLGSDAASLSADPATTTDAIIRMRGFVELGAGTYNFKVTADDGYQIRVDGVVVAQVNQNQSVNTATHTQFTVAAEGLHNIEIIYWDQGGVAKLKLELSDDAGVSYDILSSIPSYRNTVFSAVEDTPVSISAASLLANDTDVNGDTLSIQSVQGAVNGTVSLVAGSVVFTPAANYSGPASFTYTISDGQGGTDTATVNLSIAPVNDAPVAVANTVIATPNTALSIPLSTLLANDSDADKDALSLVSIQGAVNGTVNVSGTNVVFTPISNYEGAGSFTYTIRDPAGATSTATVNVNIGSATQPSVVVSKTLLAIAHGTAGTSVEFPITTALVDTDGSESISVRISGVPTGVSFNAGTNLGAGVWLVQESDLPNLMLNLPGSYSTGGTNLTVQVIATEINGGMTASTSVVVRLEAAYTTVDTPTPYHGNLTATNASEYLTGDDGNNVIVGRNGSDIINGGAGADTLSASSGSDIFFGGAGNDVITGSAGVDRISGGSGNDTLNGFVDNFVDVFVWSLGDQGVAGTPAVDTVQNFAKAAPNNNSNGGDVLDLRDLLIGEHVGANNSAGNLADFLHFEVAGGSTTIHISHTGGFGADSHTVGAAYTSSAETQKIVLSGVDLQSHYSGATTDQQIITQLLNNNKLITD